MPFTIFLNPQMFTNSTKSVPLLENICIEKTRATARGSPKLPATRIPSCVTNCIGTDSKIIDTRYVRNPSAQTNGGRCVL